MNKDIHIKAEQWVADHIDEMKELLDTLCRIPAPSGKEEKRAEFCKQWLENIGAEGVYIDEALNVVYPYCDNGGKIAALLTHTDTVFPDLEPFDVKKEGTVWTCPGIGDNTIHIAQNLMTIKFLLENNVKPERGMIFVCNSCEEGLGNLKGARQIIKDYGSRMEEFIALDGVYPDIAVRCVGSKRYKVIVKTEGGHSYGAFGNKNAIHQLSQIITELYGMEIPKIENTKTTFNVGTIEGGTSVNTIAQQAEMLFEFRSNDRKALGIMEEQFNDILKRAEERGIKLTCEVVGERPCSGDVDPVKHKALIDKGIAAINRYCSEEVRLRSGSTDCNIPSAAGIPAICVGGYKGGGAHTREEYLDTSCIETGTKIVMEVILSCM